MRKRLPGSSKLASPSASSSPKSQVLVRVADLEYFINDWLTDCEFRQHSPRTLKEARDVVTKFQQHLLALRAETFGTAEICRYLIGVGQGLLQKGGRWGKLTEPRPVRPRTVYNHWSYLRTFFNWLVAAELIPASPMARVRAPIVRADQIRPLSEQQLLLVFGAARHSGNRWRDEAILLLLLDTMMRASELCALRMKDLDLGGNRCTVRGKGNKYRVVYFGRTTKKVLWKYLSQQPRGDNDPVFQSVRGTDAAAPLTRDGLRQVIERLGKAAGIQGVRCTPHSLRHTGALRFLNSGGNVFSLQQLLGHQSLEMTKRYLALAQADLEVQARNFSPVDSLKNDLRWCRK